MNDNNSSLFKWFQRSNQGQINQVAFPLIGIIILALIAVAYNNLNVVHTDLSQLVNDTATTPTANAILNIDHTISQTITELFTIVILGTIFFGIFVWKLIKQFQLSQLLASRLGDGVCITNKRLEVQSVNQEFCRLMNLDEKELYGKTLLECFPAIFPLKPTKPLEDFSQEFVGKEIGALENHLKITLSFTEQKNRGPKFGIFTVHDITSLKKTEENLRDLACTDELTLLPNRAQLMTHIALLIHNCTSSGERFALYILDLDGFKDINDCLGLKVGDEFLKRMAERLSKRRRNNDFVARLGSNAFCILLEDVTDLSMLETFSERLLDRVSEPLFIGERSIIPQASIGYALFPDHADSKESLLQAADMAMHTAKRAGKHHAVLFNSDFTNTARDRLDLEYDLRIAFSDEQFVLFYQPQVSLQTGHMTGVEALIRWQHPERGMVFPDEFIDSIERLDLMEDLGDWVILEACKQQRRWHDDGVDLNVAVNISGSHFQSGNLIDTTLKALATAGISPQRLELEITENVMQVADATIENFVALRDLGVKIAIDDFGTGYSSLGSLRTLPVDHLKVDRMFLLDVLVDEKQAVIISTIIGMAHALGLKVIVEGVETMDHILLLQSLGCNIVQGYYFSKPIAAVEIPALYHAGFQTEQATLVQQHMKRG